MAEEKQKVQEEFTDQVLAVNRVAKKIKGGDKIGFTALVAVGNRSGRVGLGYGKASNLRSAIDKAQVKAKKNVFAIPIKESTLPRTIRIKEGAGKVLLMPAPRGAGLIAGGVIRSILELAGYQDASAKVLGTDNPVTNAKAVVKALKTLAREENGAS
ncbi:30S ribosomal protein S5 [Candidatus Saccharibacteria bacterium]|nr:30S ribosomal protein S5 [Candidatus Saccharibacteria bacterium]